MSQSVKKICRLRSLIEELNHLYKDKIEFRHAPKPTLKALFGTGCHRTRCCSKKSVLKVILFLFVAEEAEPRNSDAENQNKNSFFQFIHFLQFFWKTKKLAKQIKTSEQKTTSCFSELGKSRVFEKIIDLSKSFEFWWFSFSFAFQKKMIYQKSQKITLKKYFTNIHTTTCRITDHSVTTHLIWKKKIFLEIRINISLSSKMTRTQE